MANISSYLNTIRTATSGESVRTAIANALTAINQDNPVTVQGKTITSNGTYTAEGGIAFNPVTVQVPDGGAKDYNFIDIEIVENGEYPKAEDKAKNTYYDKVTVAVPQFANDLMEERKITKNGEYEALLDGYDGYAKVIVDVSGVDTDTYTCTFVDENGTPLRTVPNIPSGGWCSDNGLRPASATGKAFQGWNPAPNDIRYNIICRPTYYDPQTIVGEIPDDWATIVANKGEPYPIGSYKTLPLAISGNEILTVSPDSYFDAGDGTIVPPISLSMVNPIMMKVANGEDVSTSSWMSVQMGSQHLGPFTAVHVQDDYCLDSFRSSWSGPGLYGGNYFIVEEVGKRFGWGTSALRYFLNGDFLNLIPENVRQAIVPVTKVSSSIYSVDGHGTKELDKFSETRDAVWIPSTRELLGEPGYASTGIIYTDFRDLVLASQASQIYMYDYWVDFLSRDINGAWNIQDAHVYKNRNYIGAGVQLICESDQPFTQRGQSDYGASKHNVVIGFCL